MFNVPLVGWTSSSAAPKDPDLASTNFRHALCPAAQRRELVVKGGRQKDWYGPLARSGTWLVGLNLSGHIPQSGGRPRRTQSEREAKLVGQRGGPCHWSRVPWAIDF